MRYRHAEISAEHWRGTSPGANEREAIAAQACRFLSGPRGGVPRRWPKRVKRTILFAGGALHGSREAENGMISVRLCMDGAGKHCQVESETEIRRVLEDPDALVWLDIDRDDLTHLKPLGDLIHLHPLAMEDAASPHQRPILTRYGDTLFLVLYELTVENREGPIATYPISFFVGQNYVVTARDIERGTLDEVAQRWHEFDAYVKNKTAGFLLYAIVDALVDSYFPVIDMLGDRMNALEDQIVGSRHDGVQRNIHAFRKELFQVRRVVGPGREVLNELIRRDTPVLNEEVINYLHDVYDHILRVLDWLDAYHDMVSNLFDMQLAISSHRLDQVMRTLTVASIMLMVSSLIAGIYGMNFADMPELSWRYGYPMALGIMVTLMSGLYVFFKRRGWM
jgi:magnesium transporter